jgi:ribosome biogenesis GTPase
VSKRKLSRQQQSRIAAKQERQFRADSGSIGTSYDKCNGRVVSHFGQQLDVEALTSTSAAIASPDESDKGYARKIVRCFQRANLPELVTGDYVVFEYEDDDTGVIVASAERRNVFARPGFGGKIKPVAANLDVVLVVIAPLPQAFGNLVDRYLVAINTLGLQSMLVLNKEDLLDEGDPEPVDALLSLYAELGYPVFKVSAKTGKGIAELESSLTNKTTVLVGQSGVGKSSLLNRLAGLDDVSGPFDELAETGALSQGKYKGTHTTTTARLFHLLHCDLIDSPGIREFDLGHVSRADVVAGFPEIAEYALHCKFRDCSHSTEPGCAVLSAAEEGLIRQERMLSFRQILQSIDPKQG